MVDPIVLQARSHGKEVTLVAQRDVRKALEEAFVRYGGCSTIAQNAVSWAVNVAASGPAEDWAHETLYDEALSYLQVLRTDFEAAVAISNEMAGNETTPPAKTAPTGAPTNAHHDFCDMEHDAAEPCNHARKPRGGALDESEATEALTGVLDSNGLDPQDFPLLLPAIAQWAGTLNRDWHSAEQLEWLAQQLRFLSGYLDQAADALIDEARALS